MNQSLHIRFRDEAHLAAHADHFTVPLEHVMEWVRARLEQKSERSGWEHFDFACPRNVGFGGLKRIRPWTRGDFWAPRKGRSIPSHLIVGGRHPTRRLCVWGFWEDTQSFVVHTLYPGRAAPREIHDPELSVSELPQALRFWARHAIIVSESERDE